MSYANSHSFSSFHQTFHYPPSAPSSPSQGGVRAVVYTDILQVFVLMVGILVIMVTALVEVGGLGRMWDIAWEHGRVELWK